ncbi:lectin-like [Mercenaria mercenaria]|uniref:lectin-like n=1 Tax=Mercenaria mercenaria TaxID=6596 RepID=UPI00234F65F7|nr:lectin-like [Mercenaria mercenaria]
MTMSLTFFALWFFIIYSEMQEMFTYSLVSKFNGSALLEAHTCSENFVVFELKKSLNTLHCFLICRSYPSCFGVFYQPEAQKCVGCSTKDESEFLITLSPSLYFERADMRACSEFSCYLLVPEEHTWSVAKNNCELHGGVLVSITSQEEQDFLNDFLLSNDNVPPRSWIGGYKNESVFVWLDGSSVEYGNWKSGEPNGDGHCIEMWHFANNIWNDAGCNYQFASICEFK